MWVFRSPPLWQPLLIAGGVALAAYYFAENLLDALFGSVAAPAARPRKSESAEVDMSVFAPPSCGRGDTVLVQVLLHEPEMARAGLLEVAQFADADAQFRAVKSLIMPLEAGDRVNFVVSAPGCEVEQPSETVVWRGGGTAWAAFPVTVPAEFGASQSTVTLRALKNGEPIGYVAFTLAVKADNSVDVVAVGDAARHYDQTFFSYASADRPTVVRYAHAWTLLKKSFFQDFLSLDPGERWERRLYEEIDRCDLFLLFWSSEARNSKYVLAEANYALARRNGGQDIDILPVIIEGPPCPSPPESLSDIHFNDSMSYVLASVMNEAALRARAN